MYILFIVHLSRTCFLYIFPQYFVTDVLLPHYCHNLSAKVEGVWFRTPVDNPIGGGHGDVSHVSSWSCKRIRIGVDYSSSPSDPLQSYIVHLACSMVISGSYHYHHCWLTGDRQAFACRAHILSFGLSYPYAFPHMCMFKSQVAGLCSRAHIHLNR